MAHKNLKSPFLALEAFDAESDELNIVIETPKGSRNKFEYDDQRGVFKLGGVLPLGAVFPFDFGYVPSTVGGDGDPLDVLVLMDEPAFPGCLVPGRLIGVIEANQTEEEETTRNDRLIAVATDSRNHSEVRTLEDLPHNVLDEIEHFFVSYNDAKGKEFEVLGRYGPDRAMEVVNAGIKKFSKPARSKTK
ncbi:MAG: inorganic pyrophosphatase [Blastocatellia bacterium]|jgi:inorganic pyrophosphatase|nr:inorganic pyrophosphatase [Blastocatellia bacterium]